MDTPLLNTAAPPEIDISSNMVAQSVKPKPGRATTKTRYLEIFRGMLNIQIILHII